jgi:hypothetical protein
MPTYPEQLEQAYKQSELAVIRRATDLGLTTREYRERQKKSVEDWAVILHEIMEQHGAHDDPLAVLPQILTRVMEDAGRLAEKRAETAARSVVLRMLRKVMG